ncbi:sensor histidine kinase [Haloarchaeobius sp. DFWS5]|uniref:sensor histidine kinase n=1 Tax=Haloarchaeobius sp. DFWS5 TaxID=3446114 RepID=UPI003EB73EA4
MANVLDRYPGLPVAVVGVAYLLFGVAHLYLSRETPVPAAVESLLLLVIAVGLLYGGWRVSQLSLTSTEALRLNGVALAFGGVGFVVATVFIATQELSGVDIRNEPLLVAGAAGATIAIGVGIAEFRKRLLTQQATLQRQNEAVDALNHRLTVLNRVLRHNMRNEMTIIRGYASQALESDTDDSPRHALETVVAHADNVGRLSEHAKRLNQVWDEDETTTLDLASVVDESVEDVQSVYPNATIAVDVADSLAVVAHPRLRFAVTEAVENAIRHNDPDTVVTVSVSDADEAGTVELCIADTGSGIAADEVLALDRETEDSLTHGSGLGLWLIYWVTTKSGGTLSFGANEPQGTVVQLSLPNA